MLERVPLTDPIINKKVIEKREREVLWATK
jgi:hypothetical protein